MNKIKHSIRFAFCLFLLVGCHHTKSIAPIANSQIAYITMDNTQVLYRGFDSMFEYDAQCSNGCETYLEVEGGTIRILASDNSNLAVLKADSLSKQAILKMYCACDKDTTLLLTKEYPIKTVPHPQVYYGGVNLTDYTLFNDTVKFNPSGIRASYAHVPGLMNASAAIYNCTYTFRGTEYRLNGIRKTFQASILNEMKMGEKIYFNFIQMRYPDGRSVTIQLKREITKASTLNDTVFILR